ncbi:class I SAM-dependent methyltransferase [Aquihabitans sp. G128]|uniref:SAM-dependent methyltransferase n=1 Tax=Aquihabitans sp. G128 TaxID=2849779 RepID=UPI001C24C289|nr:class I SAM-dependent methyltransferase [Aquihabitans sp. G128]QXC60293.1 class I SAM-dependent methyltransferase [Aquihabitans sp. G128]
MRPTTSEAARRARSGFADAGPQVRLHTAIRQRCAPLDAVEALVPASGHILDLGCGHGLLSLHLVLASDRRTVHAVDISSDKVRHGRRAARRLGLADRVAFEVVPAGWEPPAGAYDAVVVGDVLYLLDPPALGTTVRAACRSLRDRGVLVLKEVATRPRWKHRFGMAQELVAVRLLRITAGDALNPRPLDDAAAVLDALGWTMRSIPLDRGYPYAHAALVATRP